MIDRLVDGVGRAVAWLNLAIVGVTCVVVVLRYAFDTGAVFLQESVVYMHGAALNGKRVSARSQANVWVGFALLAGTVLHYRDPGSS